MLYRAEYRAGLEGWVTGRSVIHSPVQWPRLPLEASSVEACLALCATYWNFSKINYEIRIVDARGEIVGFTERNPSAFYKNRE